MTDLIGFTESQVFAGTLGGTLLAPSDMSVKLVVLIIPGSGPTDRDGNSPLGIRASTYRLLARGLADHGIASVRVDKRGLYLSSEAAPDPNAVTVADYAADVETWINRIRELTGAEEIWLLGHSEGGLVASVAAMADGAVRGIVLAAAPGRALGDVLRSQLRANAANAPILDEAFAAIDALENGQRVDETTMHPALKPLFRSETQAYLIDAFSYNPAELLSGVSKPVLIVQGTNDLQIGVEDARLLAKARPEADLLLLPEVNHVLKPVSGDDTASNLATYGDPGLPLAAGIVEAISEFIERHHRSG